MSSSLFAPPLASLATSARRRFPTLRGLGPDDTELTDSDIFETDGIVKRTTVSCPPPSATYSIIVPRNAKPAVELPVRSNRRVA